MTGLVDLERIVVDDPRPAQVAANRCPADVVVVGTAEVPVVAAEQEIEGDDLDHRRDDTLVRFGGWRDGFVRLCRRHVPSAQQQGREGTPERKLHSQPLTAARPPQNR
jgi:hypothetical protein